MHLIQQAIWFGSRRRSAQLSIFVQRGNIAYNWDLKARNALLERDMK